MNLNKHVVRSFIGSVPLFLIAVGCNNAPEYKYQNVSNPAATHEGKVNVVPDVPKESNVAASTAPQAEPAAPQVVEPAIPEVSVGELLQNSNSYDNKKIKVTGRKGKLQPYYNMAFIINSSDDSYIEFSYEKMSNPDKGALSRLTTLQRVTISGVWDATKKVLAGEELIPSM